MTATNEHTGDKIKTGKGDQKKYENGWDSIWGNKSKKDAKVVDTNDTGGKVAPSSQ